MHRDRPFHSLTDVRTNPIIQQYKMKTILFISSTAICCLVTLALCSAGPITTTPSTDESTDVTLSSERPAVGYLNGSKLVITHVVKTLEFEVGLLEDDNSTEETSTDLAKPAIQTEIQVINPALLAQVVNITQLSNQTIDGTKNESDDTEDVTKS